jgi:nitrate/nitrite transporter NarK
MEHEETDDQLVHANHDAEAHESSPLLLPGSENNANSSSPTPAGSNDPVSIPEDVPSKTRSTAATLSVLLIGVFISNADGTLVMTVYTTISSNFNSFSTAAWLTTSYILASSAFQPIVGKLSDIYGRKGVLLVSYAVFALGCIGT